MRFRHCYIDHQAGLGDTFGVFADLDAVIAALRACGRSLATHTVRRTECGFICTVKGY